MPRRTANSPLITKPKPKKATYRPSQTLTGKQRSFINEYYANGRNAADAYRKSYMTKGTPQSCSVAANALLKNPKIARVIASRERMIALVQERLIEDQDATEERIIQTVAALAFYDPRELLTWDEHGVRLTPSEELNYRAVLPIREISVLPNGGYRVRFHDRRAALMDLARLRGMITDPSRTFHFHEDLARMPPEEQHKRVAELLEFAASLKVPPTIVTEQLVATEPGIGVPQGNTPDRDRTNTKP